MADPRAERGWGWILPGASLVGYSLAVSALPFDSPIAFAANLSLAAVALVVARRRGYGALELGVARAAVGPGVRWGLAFAPLVVGSVVAVALLRPGLLGCTAARLAGYGWPLVTFHALVRAPIVTAAVEEILFRGILLARLRRRLGEWAAAVWSSVFFGLWHIGPTVAVARQSASAACPDPTWVAVAGAVAITFCAGLLLWFLRRRSGSVLAPALVHAASSSSTLVAAFVALGLR